MPQYGHSASSPLISFLQFGHRMEFLSEPAMAPPSWPVRTLFSFMTCDAPRVNPVGAPLSNPALHEKGDGEGEARGLSSSS